MPVRTISASMWNFDDSSLLPLLAEMRRADDREALDLATIEQLAGDQPGLDGLADADVVGDQEPHRLLAERHQERHQLVGARLDAEIAEGAERPGAGAELEPHGVAQEQAGRAASPPWSGSGRGKVAGAGL